MDNISPNDRAAMLGRLDAAIERARSGHEQMRENDVIATADHAIAMVTSIVVQLTARYNLGPIDGGS